jgi:hypothetical protein
MDMPHSSSVGNATLGPAGRNPTWPLSDNPPSIDSVLITIKSFNVVNNCPESTMLRR